MQRGRPCLSPHGVLEDGVTRQGQDQALEARGERIGSRIQVSEPNQKASGAVVNRTDLQSTRRG